MTPTGKPDGDHEVERPDAERPPQAPPPPRWLEERDSPADPLLPGDDVEETREGDGTGGPADPAANAPLPAPPVAQPPATSTDIPAPPPFPYAPEPPGAPEGPAAPAEGADATRAEAPAPPPFPYGQQIPDATRAERLPAPPAPSQQPPPPAQSPPAHEPFPYAQQIPATPARPAPEPFPYAQEIPGGPPAPPAAEPFPWAQQVPGAPQAGPEDVRPVAPPPVIEEPWRTTPPGGAKRRRNLKKPLLIGVGGLAAAALAAAGVLVVPGLLKGDGDGGAEDARLAGSIFPVDGTARTDGRGQQLTDVAADGSTVVAVGSESGVSRARGLFLVSADGGRTFKSATVRGTNGGPPPTTAVPRIVAASSRGWIAIGSSSRGGAVWTSPDGQTWTRQPDAVGRVFGPGTRVNQIVSTGDGFVAIGATSAKGDFRDAEAAVWLSADGRQWEARIGDQIGLEISKASYSLAEVAASGDVILLKALIEPDNKKPPQYRKVWRSQDGGRTWAVSEVPVPKGSRGLTVGGGEAGFLAVREMRKGGRSYGQTFVSKDGKDWDDAGRLQVDGYGHTRRILGDAGGYTALVAGGGDVLLSRSTDGATWRPTGSAPGKPGRRVAGAASAGEQTILVGDEPGGGDMDPLLNVWDAAGRQIPVDTAKVPGLIRPDHVVQAAAASDSVAVAVGSAAGDAAVWTSADGASWKSAQGLGAAFTRPGPQRLLDVTSGGAGWLAVGYDQVGPKHPLVVTSADGTTWQAVDSAAQFRTGKAGPVATNAAASGSAGYVVVGTEGLSASAWFSADLKNWERGSSADPNAMKGKEKAGRWMLDVAGGGSGFTAVGGVRDAKGNHPAIWSSPDGRRWTLKTLPLPSGVKEGHLTHVAAKDRVLVAAGIAATVQGPVWIGYVSADGGGSWRELPAPDGDGKIIVTALAATPDGFAATATSGDAGSTDVVSLTSADGSGWKAAKPGGTGLGGPGDQRITGLATFGNDLLGVGRSANGDGDQPVLWTRRR